MGSGIGGSPPMADWVKPNSWGLLGFRSGHWGWFWIGLAGKLV